MSQFIDKLNQASQVGAQPIGFRATQSISPKSKMLLIVSLAQTSLDDLAGYVAGADAGLLYISSSSSGAKNLQKVCQAVPDIPWGGWLGDIGEGEIKKVVEVGCDFVVFPAANTALAILQHEGVGKILQVEALLSEDLLRTVNELPVDGVLIASEQEREHFLTWHDLMLFQRFANSLTKPLLVPIPSNATANELQALGESGVDGVIVEVGVGQPVGRLNELRQVIDKLTFPSQRKQRNVEALLPYIGGEAGIVAEEEE